MQPVQRAWSGALPSNQLTECSLVLLSRVFVVSDDFKPASVDPDAVGELELRSDSNASLLLPQKSAVHSSLADVSCVEFSGHTLKKAGDAAAPLCLLLFDAARGEFRLERVEESPSLKQVVRDEETAGGAARKRRMPTAATMQRAVQMASKKQMVIAASAAATPVLAAPPSPAQPAATPAAQLPAAEKSPQVRPAISVVAASSGSSVAALPSAPAAASAAVSASPLLFQRPTAHVASGNIIPAQSAEDDAESALEDEDTPPTAVSLLSATCSPATASVPPPVAAQPLVPQTAATTLPAAAATPLAAPAVFAASLPVLSQRSSWGFLD